jgi:23S rRNA (cytosine1962-C5)-methyltransferase
MRSAFASAFANSCAHRRALLDNPDVTAYRLFDGAGDGIAGIYVDRYGPAGVLNVYDDAKWSEQQISAGAHTILESLRADGLESVYVKRFSKDRSRLGGKAPAESTAAKPRAGIEQPAVLTIEEYGARFEIKPYDGFSTGLFLEHREHRRALGVRGAKRALNLFAYTCAFSVPLARSGALVTNVDVSARYLDWGRRNHEINGVDMANVRFKRMDAIAYLKYAARHAEERFDLVILDPPTFGAANTRRNVKTWKAATDYPKLLKAAVDVLAPRGLIFAATNTRELADNRTFKRMITGALDRVGWEKLPPWPADVRERGRVAAALFHGV